MKRTIYYWTFLMIIAFFACKPNEKGNNNPNLPPISTFFENYYEDKLKLNPFEATQIGDNRYNDQFPNDLSSEFRKKAKETILQYQTELKKYDVKTLSVNDKMSYDILNWELDMQLKGLEQKDIMLPINQFWGNTLLIPQLGAGESAVPFKTMQDYDNWLKRLTNFPAWCDTAIVKMRLGIEQGWVLPKALTMKVIPQLKDLIAKDATKSVFYMPIQKLPAEISSTDKARLTEAYRQAVITQVNPSYQRLLDFMEKEYLPKSRASSGISALSGGRDYYNYLVKYWTTTNLTAEEIHQIGLDEVKRLRTEMEKVKEQVGFKGDLKAFFNHVNHLKALHPYTEDKQVIEGFNKIHEKMKPKLTELFDMVPKSKFEVRQTEKFREASASAEYNQGTADGTRPGIFYVPVLDAKDYNIFQDEDLFLHEAIPGHHYQCMLQAENKDLPRFRRNLWYGAYGEGWALYTESLGKELGLYDDPYQYFGRLGAEMHRSIRLVVDTGIHALGWTREQAIQYSLENEAESEQSTIAEIERYMAIPGQALSYKIGQMKILELRAKAQNALGDKFNIKKFHNEMLKYGCLPLATLENRINAWIEEMKK